MFWARVRKRAPSWGAWTDAGVSSKVGNLLENNEQSIKKYVRGNDEN